MHAAITKRWAFARVHLGLSEREFWRLTPYEFQLLVEQHQERENRRTREAASMMALIANCHRSSDARPFEIEDFISNPNAKEEPRDLGDAFAILKNLKQ
jgi:hypothetical protein